MTVYTDGTCAYPLAKGGRYLLFLQMTDGDAFGTSKCAGNKRATEAEAVVRWLDKRSAATTSKKKS